MTALRVPLAAAIAAFLCCGRAGAAEAADVVYENGHVYTVDPRRPWAQAVAIGHGRFMKVGSAAEMKAVTGPKTSVVDLGGRFVLPGLIDSHTHPSFEAELPYHFETGFPWTFLARHDRIARLVGRIARPSREQRLKALVSSMTIMSSLGITAIGEGKTEAALLPVWEALVRERGLDQHVAMYMHALDFAGTRAVQHAPQIEAAFRRHRLPGVRVGAKIFVDGYLDYRTALLVEPYRDAARVVGRSNASPAEISALVDELDAAGIPIQLHAIGDGAVRLALDALEGALVKHAGRAGPVHSIVHLKLVHPGDVARFARLGVGATLYPFLAQPAPPNDLLAGALGAERVEERYLALARLWDAGAIVGSNSDWASASMNPFYGMYVGVTRQSPGHPERGKLGASNAVTLERMIRSYTINNAALLNMDRDAGSIEQGKWADMVVLDRNILERPIEELLETTVATTIFKGRVVYDASGGIPDALAATERALLELGNAH